MEKTFAREVYKNMVIGVEYKISDLMTLVETESRLPYFPEIEDWNDLKNFDFKSEFVKAMRSIVDAGYAVSGVKSFSGYCTKGQKFGTEHNPNREYRYTARVYVRIK